MASLSDGYMLSLLKRVNAWIPWTAPKYETEYEREIRRGLKEELRSAIKELEC